MDFKSLMSAQIAKSKPVGGSQVAKVSTGTSATTSSTTTTTTATTPQPKYQRRSEQEAERQAAYAAEQARLEAERLQKVSAKRKLEEEEAEQNAIREEKKQRLAVESAKRREEDEIEQERLRRKRLGLPPLPSHSPSANGIENGGEEEQNENQPEIPDQDLRVKLRDMNEPAIMYDESYTMRLKRYYKLVNKMDDGSDSPSSTAMTKRKRKTYTKGPIPTTLEPIPEKDMLIAPPKTISSMLASFSKKSSSSPSQPKHKADSRKGEGDKAGEEKEEVDNLSRQLSSYFTLLLTEWSIALDARSSDVRASSSGKQATNTYLSVVRDLTPLYRKLESRTLSTDLITPICEIVHYAQMRRYVDANDAYLRLSIGKAAWPIGVTMVGIHERSAREKLHEGDGDKKANILADEVTRKMLQSVKRCLSFAQTRWPPEDLGQLMG